MAILDQYGRPYASPRSNRWRDLLARYDAAQTTDENRRHWQYVDNMSADAANSPEVRRLLRTRSRYEAANNCYARGIGLTLATDVIGQGPRLQVRTSAGKGGRDADRQIEAKFHQWARAVKLGKKLRTMRKAKCIDGEAFAILSSNRRLPTPVTLDVRVIECDRVMTPYLSGQKPDEVDGIRLDESGEPSAYHILKAHPGGNDAWQRLSTWDGTWYDANRVIHIFRQDRAEQHRGIPELTPALRLFSQLRRYVLAVLAAAETAADFAAVIYSNAPAGEDDLDAAGDTETSTRPEPMDVFELAQRLVTVLPDGYQLGQIKAEQPSTRFGEFKREVLAEAFACVCMPYNTGAHDSADHNYSSGKLDRLTYGKVVTIEESDWDVDCCDRIFLAWLEWAFTVPDYLPSGLPPVAAWTWSWMWDGQEDIDPVKSATAIEIQLRSGQTSFQELFALRGKDFETEMGNQARALNLSMDQYLARLTDKLLGPSQEQSNAVTQAA